MQKCSSITGRIIVLALCAVMTAACFTGCTQAPKAPTGLESRLEDIVSGMSTDEKISQLIIPAIRSWDGENVTDLSLAPDLKAALRKHQYGGIILFGENITGTEQTAKLLRDLQQNNADIEGASTHIPYFTPVDQEGGIVARLVSGTRMTGNMAIGATGEAAAENAKATGKVIGEELSALGFNVDFAPVVDVNNNPANPIIGTRSFSDDPQVVAELGAAYAEGLSGAGVIPTFKHFPGHGDTGTDSHIGLPSVEKTYDEIKKNELVPYERIIKNGAEIIMTAHITFPLIDEEVVYGDGETKGFLPATMSEKIITGILRKDMGYDGIVITDALEMAAIRTAALVPGKQDSAEYSINVAAKILKAGVDILLLPLDITDKAAVEFYDEYIAGLVKLVEEGAIPEAGINESVRRILKLKDKYGILDAGKKTEKALSTVGSDAHHDIEITIARQAVTLVKNEGGALPLGGSGRKYVVLARQEAEMASVKSAVTKLMEDGAAGENSIITVDYYYDASQEGERKVHISDETKRAIAEADAVIALAHTTKQGTVDKTIPQNKAIFEAMELAHKAGSSFIVISVNLPYDAALFTDADAILLAYMGSGLGLDPTERSEQTSDRNAYNANIIAALEIAFGVNKPKGHLPVNIPELVETSEGHMEFGSAYAYERGFGITEWK